VGARPLPARAGASPHARRAPTNCVTPAGRHSSSSNPRSRSASVISSRPKTRIPVTAPTADSRPRSSLSARPSEVRSAIRPPGRRTARSGRARGAGRRAGGAPRNSTRRRRHRRRTGAPRRRRGRTRRLGSPGARLSAAALPSIVGETSIPTARPAGPTVRASSRGEVAAAGDVEHGRAAAALESQQLARESELALHARAERPLGDASERRPPWPLVDTRDDPGQHEVLRSAGRGRRTTAEQVKVAVRHDGGP
jgi:hypothetical protein